MNLLVNIVSVQTIPNVQFIKQFYEEGDELLFIVTEQSIGYAENIRTALNRHEADKLTKLVNVYDIQDMQDKLDKINYSKYENILVNITGGTKPMSLATYTFFCQDKFAPKVAVYYIEGYKSEYIKIFPSGDNNLTPFNNCINIEEYVKAYGLKMGKKNSLTLPKEYTMEFYDRFEDFTWKEFEPINDIREQRDQKLIKIEAGSDVEKFLTKINFPYTDQKLTRSQATYLSGGWFEEYIACRISDCFNIPFGEQLVTSLKLTQSNTINEYDVVFMYKNKLHIIECKTFIVNKERKELVNNTIYKSTALKQMMGSYVKSFICTLNYSSDIKDAQILRSNTMKLPFICKENIDDEESFEQIIEDGKFR